MEHGCFLYSSLNDSCSVRSILLWQRNIAMGSLPCRSKQAGASFGKLLDKGITVIDTGVVVRLSVRAKLRKNVVDVD